MQNFQRPWYLYLVEVRQPAVKVGITADPQTRRSQVQACSPLPIDMHIVWPFPDKKAAQEAERQMHQLLKPAHMHGEWYEVHIYDAISWTVQKLGVEAEFIDDEAKLKFYSTIRAEHPADKAVKAIYNEAANSFARHCAESVQSVRRVFL